MRATLTAVLVVVLGSSCMDKTKQVDAGTPVPAPAPLAPVAVQVEVPPPVLSVHAVIGDGSGRVITRGSVASIRTGAVALGIDGGIPLTESSLSLTITARDGGVQPWVFDRLTPPKPNHVLTGTDFDANIVWSMEGAQTSLLPLGTYVLRFAWAGTWTELWFDVLDPPQPPSAKWNESDVYDRIDDLMKRHKVPEARALMNQAQATWPDSYNLLNLNALLFEAEGDMNAGLRSASRAEQVWTAKNPGKKRGYGHGSVYRHFYDEVIYKELLK